MRRTITQVLCTFGSLAALSSCSPDRLAYYYPKVDQATITSNQNPTEVLGGIGKIDLIWVIDNSYSMYTWQKAVIKNSQEFMQSLIQLKIKWKMGLISTSGYDSPYLGFAPGDELNYNSVDPVALFEDGVQRLGINGSGTEMLFTPLLNSFAQYPDFLSKDNTPLAIIVVTDAPEQSWVAFSDFYKKFKTIVGSRDVYLYGVFGAQDKEINCEMTDDPFIYAGSPYELFFGAVQYSKVYPLCSPDFGQNLAKIGEDIALKAGLAKIYLEHRPKLSTLKLMNGDVALPRGDVMHEGAWFYDFNLNAVCIYDTELINRDQELKVFYEKDDGNEK